MLSQRDIDRIRAAVKSSFPDSMMVSRIPDTPVSDGAGGSSSVHVDQPLLIYRCRILPITNPLEGLVAEKISSNARFRIHTEWNADVRPPDRVKVKAGGVGPEKVYEIVGEDEKISEQAALTLLAAVVQ